jgi:hypothetical protein
MKLLAVLTKALPLLALIVGLGSGAASTAVAAPTLAEVSPRGLQAGGTTTLTFVGNELGAQPRILLPFAVAKQAAKPGGQPNQVQIEVTLDKGIPPGIYHLRLATDDGISNALAIGVDELPQQRLAAEVSNLPVALHASLTGGTVIETRFTGKAGQRVVVDLEARRLGGGLDPVLEIHRPGGVPLAYSPGQEVLGGDARLDVTLPADGVYTVSLRDALYRGAGPGHFRLKIGQLQYADVVLPLGIERGKPATLEAVVGNLADGVKWTMQSDSRFGIEPAALPAGTFTGGRPRVIVSDSPEIAEAATAGGALQEVAAPAGISGRILSPGEVDRYRLRVKPLMRLRFDVLADRIGSPMDAVLSIQKPDGGQLAAADDGQSTTDPTIDFTVPGGMETVVVVLQDQTRRGSPRNVYRIGVTELKPDFSLSALVDRVNVPQGGVALLRVRAQRSGYNGPIKLSFPAGLPSGVSLVGGDTIPAGATDALLALRAEPSAAGAAIGQMIGQGVGGDANTIQPVLATDTPTTRYQPWLRRELPVAVTRAAPIQVAWEDSAAGASLLQGTTQPLGAKITRASGIVGPVRLSLLTSQVPPIVTAEGPNKGQPDVAQTLRVDAPVNVAANQTGGALPIVVPPALPVIEYDVAVRAELLSPDGQRVVAETVSPPRRVSIVAPSFTLALTSAAKIEARAGKGPTGKLTGRITRVGFAHPITLSLAGLPQGVASPTLVVPGDKSEFEFAVALPKDVKPGELKGVKLVGSSQLSPQKTVAAANQIDVVLNVVPGE